MKFGEHLQRYGPSIKELTEMPLEKRRLRAFHVFNDWLTCRPEQYSRAFLEAFDLATEVMVFMHVAQEARAAKEEEGCPRCGQIDNDSGFQV